MRVDNRTTASWAFSESISISEWMLFSVFIKKWGLTWCLNKARLVLSCSFSASFLSLSSLSHFAISLIVVPAPTVRIQMISVSKKTMKGGFGLGELRSGGLNPSGVASIPEPAFCKKAGGMMILTAITRNIKTVVSTK